LTPGVHCGACVIANLDKVFPIACGACVVHVAHQTIEVGALNELF
jgi:hypothetical protein